MKYKVGQLVVNAKLGLGKVLESSGNTVTAFFKDELENPRTINVAVVPMEVAAEQSDPWFEGRDDLAQLKRHQKSQLSPRKPRVAKAAKVTAA